MIVVCEGNPFLAIVHVLDILVNSRSCLEINSMLLMESVVSIQFQICRLIETQTATPPSEQQSETLGVNIGQSHWRWNRLMGGTMMKTKGAFIQVVDPEIKLEIIGQPFYVFTSDELRALAASLFSTISIEDRSRLPSLRKRTDNFPYRSGGK